MVYSAFHRIGSIKRFVGIEEARELSMIDIDAILWIEAEHTTKEPIAIIETAERSNEYKASSILRKLARRAAIPAYVVLHESSKHVNPNDIRWPDIDQFLVKRIWPNADKDYVVLSPQEYAKKLLEMRSYSTNYIKVNKRT